MIANSKNNLYMVAGSSELQSSKSLSTESSVAGSRVQSPGEEEMQHTEIEKTFCPTLKEVPISSLITTVVPGVLDTIMESEGSEAPFSHTDAFVQPGPPTHDIYDDLNSRYWSSRDTIFNQVSLEKSAPLFSVNFKKNLSIFRTEKDQLSPLIESASPPAKKIDSPHYKKN